MSNCSFKIRINGTPLAGFFYGQTTGLESAVREFNKRVRHGNPGDCVEIVVYSDGQKITIRKEYIEP